MKKRVSALLTALLLALVFCVGAFAEIIEPTEDYYYYDEPGVLSVETKGEIFFANELLRKDCSAELVVVVLNSTNGVKLEDYAAKLFKKWEIGTEKNYGFLLIEAIEDDDYYYTIGSGLDRYITAGDIGDIADSKLEPKFAAKDYDKGTKAFFEGVLALVAKKLNSSVTAQQAINAYKAYVKENGTPENVGETTAERVSNALADKKQNRPANSEPVRNPEPENDGFFSDGFGFTVLVAIAQFVLMIVLVLWFMRRIRRRRNYGGYVTPPPPPPPMGGFGHRPTPRRGGFGFGPRPMGGPGAPGGPGEPGGNRPKPTGGSMFGGSSRSSGGSSFGGFGGSSRNSGSGFGGSSRSGGGFGGSSHSGGGGGSHGSGGGRGRR